MAITYNNLYLDTRKTLRQAGIEAHALEARELICFAAKKNKEGFYRDLGLYASEQVQSQVKALVKRRLAGEPVAYLVGQWEFYGLPVELSRETLIPRVDTERLAERAIALARAAGEGARVLDLCAGSGCVGLAVAAEAPNCRVVLVDWIEDAVRICKQNVRLNNLNARVTAIRANALETPPAVLWDFDLILCNPPYIPTEDWEQLDASVRLWEPRLALDGGADGLDFYRAISDKWRQALRPFGTLLYEVGIGQAAAVQEIMEQNGFQKLCVYGDDQQIERVVEGVLGIEYLEKQQMEESTNGGR